MVVMPPHSQSGRTNELVKLRTMETSQLCLFPSLSLVIVKYFRGFGERFGHVRKHVVARCTVQFTVYKRSHSAGRISADLRGDETIRVTGNGRKTRISACSSLFC